MKTFKVNKKIIGEPKILGLSFNLFFFFIGTVVMAAFLLISKITFLKLLFAFFIVAASYIVLKFFDSNFLNQMSDEKFPDIIICNRYK